MPESRPFGAGAGAPGGSRRPRVAGAICALALAVFALCSWAARRPPCAHCRVEELALVDADGRGVRGRAYLPPETGQPVPAIIVAHGYLANLAFMEVPWAHDLTALGAAAVFIDRRGHGRSSGRWSPAPTAPVDIARPPADLAAAVAFARAHPRIDAGRIALLGHSDGATAALVAGSLDWTLLATVAISASVAPWQLVNHIAPRNLLLVYGAQDGYVLHDTDRRLIGAATRGVLDGPGATTTMAELNTRRLLRVPERGHVDVLFSPAARAATLETLRAALHLDAVPVLRPSNTGWVLGGAGALLLALFSGLAIPPRGAPAAAQAAAPGARQRWLLLGLWPPFIGAGCLAARHLPPLPVQEGGTVLMLLAGGGLAGLLARGARGGDAVETERRGPRIATATTLRAWLAGTALALAVIAGLSMLLQHYFDAWPTRDRALLTAGIAALALPVFWTVELRLADAAPAARAAALLVLAASTALVARAGLERMAIFPAYLFAAALAFTAAVPLPAPGAAAFGALLFARAAAAVCAFY